MPESSAVASERIPSIHSLLSQADLLRYEKAMLNDLKLRHAGDIEYVDEDDLVAVGMSRPEQKRLRKEYQKMFPKASVLGRLKKAFSKENDKKSESDQEQHVIPLERITLCKELGSGEFGTVHQAVWHQGNAGLGEKVQVAVKSISSEKLLANQASFLSEAAIMHRMQHDDVVRLYGVVLDTKQIMMVTELAVHGSLASCLRRPALRDSFPIHVLSQFAVQIARGMAYLESQRLIHRDLAARNVLVFSSHKVKISDFGLSRSLGVGEDYYRSDFSPTLKLPIAWCAPECINFLKFTPASDVWAYGVTLWEMFTYGSFPWEGFNGAQILAAVDRERRVLSRPPLCPEDMYGLMVDCWQHAPDARPTFAAILASLPDRLPQPVRTILQATHAPAGHLTFHKDDLIYVIDKAPESSPDGFYWLGSLKNGRTGLFKPTDTVAHLGAEPPAPNRAEMTTSNGKEKSKKKEKEESERDRKKRLISEPIVVKHTSHLGIDGSSFGLLQMDKKDLRTSANQQTSPSNSSLRSTTSTPSICSSTRLCDSSSHPSCLHSRPPLPVPPPARHHEPSAPPLTPELSDSSMGDSWAGPNSSSNSTLDTVIGVPRGNGRGPMPIHAVYARPLKSENQPSPVVGEEAELSDQLSHLVQELTDFSLSSMASSTASDTRPLLEVSRRSRPPEREAPKAPPLGPATVRLMNEEELAKLAAWQNKEHKKVEKELRQERAKSAQPLSDCLQTPPPPDLAASWSAEAQEAYRQLVECGAGLSLTPPPSASQPSSLSPSPSPFPTTQHNKMTTPSTSSPSPTPVSSTAHTPMLHPRHSTATVTPPPRPPKSCAYDNLNGVPSSGRKPPPVPPKPKVNVQESPTKDDYGREFASAVHQSSLFSKKHHEEVIKF